MATKRTKPVSLSRAAKKGWATRRAKARAAQALRAKRSAAAKKGWETRRAREFAGFDTAPDVIDPEEAEELAEQWGVSVADVEALYDTVSEDAARFGADMTQDELRTYIDDLYAALEAQGAELDVSDLWDMYYGYTPGSRG